MAVIWKKAGGSGMAKRHAPRTTALTNQAEGRGQGRVTNDYGLLTVD
ncbi:hypothetical protein [Nostoc sp. NIES-3756]|nr:hypothetical protein [Nostoc sp. NIES-3756]